MKPKNKLQRKVLKLSQSLSPLTKYQNKEAIRKVGLHIAKYSPKRGYECLDCGHTWTEAEAKRVVCPHCAAKLEVDKTRKKNFCDKSYFAVVTKCQGFQVVRMFFMQTNLKQGSEPTYWICEAFQRWLTPEGKTQIVSRARHWLSHYCDCWNWGSDMELRDENAGHTVTPWKVVGQSSVIPEIRRNGYNGSFHKCSPYTLFHRLLTDNRTETLWKVGQYKLVAHSFSDSYKFNKYWPSIKIALRHKYQINDPSIWFDLLDSLDYLNKDLRNPNLICPVNLKAAHDEWMSKKESKIQKARERQERLRLQRIEERYLEDLKQAQKDEDEYKNSKSKFFDLEFKDKEIIIKPLISVKEFIEEGRLMHHCVFTNNYYKKQSALILHALVEGVSIATIEFSLEDFSVVQCRKAYNKKPELYDRIMTLMKRNTPQIMSKAV